MAPRKPADELDVEGEGSFVAGYERTIPAAATAPRRAEPAPRAATAAAAAAAAGAETPAARRREQLRQARAAREAADGNGDSWAAAAFASAAANGSIGRGQERGGSTAGHPHRPAASDSAGAAPAEEEEDLSRLSVSELKSRIRATGAAIPPTVVEKAELVTLLKIFGKKAPSASPPSAAPAAAPERAQPAPAAREEAPPAAAPGPAAASRARSARRGFQSWAGAAEPEERPSASSTAGSTTASSTAGSTAAGRGTARRGFASWAGGPETGKGDSSGYPATSTASAPRPSEQRESEAPSEEDLASLPLKELKKRLRELGVDIPASICEKSEIVDLLRRTLQRNGGGAAAPRQAEAEEGRDWSSRPGHGSGRADARREEEERREAERRDEERREEERRRRQDEERRRRQEEERRSRQDEEKRSRQEQDEKLEAEKRRARELEERRNEERRRALEKRREEDQKRAEERRKEEERLREEEAAEAAPPPPPPPEPEENLASLSMKELKKRITEAGGTIPTNILEKGELVTVLKKILELKASRGTSQRQQEKPSGTDLLPCQNNCGFARTWHPTHCCHNCPKHGPKCQKKPVAKGARYQPGRSAGPGPDVGPLPTTSGEPDGEEELMRLSVKELKKKCGAAGVTVPRTAEKEDLVALLQDAQRRRRSLRPPGEAEDKAADAEGNGGGAEPEEDISKLSVRELKQRLAKLGVKIPGHVTEKRELINMLRQAQKRRPKGSSGPESAKHRGANGSYDRRRLDWAKPWLPKEKERKRSQQVLPAGPPDENDKDALWLTFGYVVGMEEGCPYARFDIREETCMRFGGFKHGQVLRDRQQEKHVVVGVRNAEGRPMLWTHPKKQRMPCCCYWTGMNASKMRQIFTVDGEEELLEVLPGDFELMQDSDEETHRLCGRCRLPVGELAYVNEDGSGVQTAQHADCITKPMIEATMEQDLERVHEDWVRTWTNRQGYDIGWVPDRMIPINEHVAQKLGQPGFGGPMISLLMEGEPPRLSLTQSIEPTTSVNLNYLITALQVRLHEGREPVFSLDPCPPFDDVRNGWQKKRFEPEWMRGTPAGEVLFQADYHLKELSMGEYDQAVIGMKNAMDFSEDINYWDWRAREWFIVKTAEVWRSADGVVMPHLVMGVEAREQMVNDRGVLEDAPVTNDDHPLVIYGNDFSHNFDLIAERLSVIYHLRELTKAQIIARFIVDSGVVLDESWLRVLDRATFTELQIPQHRREIGRLQLIVRNGEYSQEEGQEIGLNIWGVYGGVDLNLDNFDLSEAQQSDKEVLPGEPIDLEKLSPEELRQMIIDHGGTVPPGITEKPDLIDIMMAIMESFTDFWGCICGSGPSPYSKEDQAVLRKIFNPFLSDRRLDGHRFIPPTRDTEYIDKLKKLLDEEWMVQEKRRSAFLSKEWTPGQHSEPFPYTWRSKYGVSIDRAPCRAIGELPGGRPLRKVEKAKARLQSLASMDVVFNGLSEEGTRYRVYQDAKYEVRTIQEHDQAETVQAVFEFEKPEPPVGEGKLRAQDKLLSVSLCTGHAYEGPAGFLQDLDQEDAEGTPHYRFFVMADTKGSRPHTIITEMLPDGTVTWEEDPVDLEHRRSRARVLRSFLCNGETVSTLRAHRKEWVGKYKTFASASSCKHYAQGAYNRAGGFVEA